MTLAELRNLVMFQTNNDADDISEFQPAVDNYINEGYDRLLYAYCEQHLDDDSDDYERLKANLDEPAIPQWTHKAIADYASYCVYRNGNAVKQSRGAAFYQEFQNVLAKVETAAFAEKKAAGTRLHMTNLYVEV